MNLGGINPEIKSSRSYVGGLQSPRAYVTIQLYTSDHLSESILNYKSIVGCTSH